MVSVGMIVLFVVAGLFFVAACFAVRSMQKEGIVTSNLPGWKDWNVSREKTLREERKEKREGIREVKRRGLF